VRFGAIDIFRLFYNCIDPRALKRKFALLGAAGDRHFPALATPKKLTYKLPT
jgi:hypothetical protein